MTTAFNWNSDVAEPRPAQSRFEGERVRMALEAFGLDSLRFELLDAHKAQYGTRRLTFAGFRERFPSFPVLLAARYVGRVSERLSSADLFRRFEDTFVTASYLEAYLQFTEEARGRPIGLVIPFGGVRSGVLVHNADFNTGSTRLTHALRDDTPPYRLTVEPFRHFLKYLAASDWSPDYPGKAPKVVNRHPALPSAVAPWMVRRLGTGPAAILLGWLTALFSSPTPGQQWVRRAEGTRYVVMARDEIAEACGLHLEALKRGLSKLKEEGFIRTVRRDRQMWVELIPKGQ